MKDYNHQELIEATHNYSKSHLIGRGSHGCIYKATLKNGKIVAIKTPSLALSNLEDTSKIENEAQILSSLAPNPYLVNLLGTTHDSNGHLVLVIEHMSGGMLHGSLHTGDSSPPSWCKRVKMIIQIARAVQYLHESKPIIIHRDIKSENILFDSKSNARLADFGLAVLMTSYDSPSQQVDSVSLPAGTIGYLDPSYTTPCKLSTKNDVFSFGVVLLEIISGTKAIDVSRTPASIVEWSIGLIEKGQTMKICDSRVNMPRRIECVIRHMLEIAIQCVSSDEESRPSMTEVVTKLERFRYPIWVDMVQRILQLKSRDKVSLKRLSTATTTVVATSGVTKRKVLLRDVLAGDVL
ncbi:serine/threonine-protein kinase-like protein At5g23170 [Rutidosis leptorrhynchoides]|uniref:serine/threonine-protein kinase-like protein At5g23170 n=1 Tax=Rutidosis leptorrhynchoides TaxID=125765 RepID=UPI003A9A2E4B